VPRTVRTLRPVFGRTTSEDMADVSGNPETSKTPPIQNVDIKIISKK